jgi:glycosyltransferase 2 family protein
MQISKLFSKNLKLLFTIILLCLVFNSVDISKIGHDLKALNLPSLALLLLVSWAGQMLCSERWRIFASSLQMQGSYKSYVQMYFAGMFFNIGLPSLVGGDIIKAYIVSSRNGKPFQIGLASVLQDRAAGLMALLLYGSLAILTVPISWKGFPLWAVYLALWIAFAMLVWFVLKGGILYGRRLIPQDSSLFQKILSKTDQFIQAMTISRLAPGAVLRIIIYSLIYAGLGLWVFHQITIAGGHRVGIIPFTALLPLVTLATMLPITISGIGVREWVYVEALALLGIPRDQGLVISLATSALLLICNFVGIFFLPYVPKRFRSGTRDNIDSAGANGSRSSNFIAG